MKIKYVLTKQTLKYKGHTLYRIKRSSDGLLGGFIEYEANLSHEGNCFIYDNAKVYGNSRLQDDAEIYGNSTISGNAIIGYNLIIHDNIDVIEADKPLNYHITLQKAFI